MTINQIIKIRYVYFLNSILKIVSKLIFTPLIYFFILKILDVI